MRSADIIVELVHTTLDSVRRRRLESETNGASLEQVLFQSNLEINDVTVRVSLFQPRQGYS